MAFLGFMTVREHDRILAKADAIHDAALEQLKGEEFKIGRTLPQRVELAVKWLKRERATCKMLADTNAATMRYNQYLAGQRDSLVAALSTVAAQSTPNANATVKRMTRIAQDAIDARYAAVSSAIEWLDGAPKAQAARGEVA